MRWFGVYFDTRFSFKNHAEKMASAARKAVSGLNMLGNTVRGVDVRIIRRAVHACILPLLTYAAPAWWNGRSCINNAGKTIRNGVEGQLYRLDKVQNTALRTILPVWRTTCRSMKLIALFILLMIIFYLCMYMCISAVACRIRSNV